MKISGIFSIGQPKRKQVCKDVKLFYQKSLFLNFVILLKKEKKGSGFNSQLFTKEYEAK